MFDCGQCTTWAPVLGEAGDVLGAEIRHVHALRARPEEADATQGVNGAFTVGLHRLQYLALGFVQVNLYRHVQFRRVGRHLLEARRADRVGRVGAEGDVHEVARLAVVAQGQALADVLVGAAAPGGRKVEHGE
jgi:hypothetical protein